MGDSMKLENEVKGRGSFISRGLARSCSLVGEKPTRVAVSHGPGIEPCRCGDENRVSGSQQGGNPYKEGRLGVKWNKFTRNGGWM